MKKKLEKNLGKINIEKVVEHSEMVLKVFFPKIWYFSFAAEDNHMGVFFRS